MKEQEIMVSIYGEFMDLISCLSIYNGAEAKKEKLEFDQIMALR